jgi:Mg-chelatase subunit ChlD
MAVAASILLTGMWPAPQLSAAASASSTAVVVILDTSGSMADKIFDGATTRSKFAIAQDALREIAKRFDVWTAANTNAALTMAMIRFDRGRPQVVAPLRPYTPRLIPRWLDDPEIRRGPGGGTPLGGSIRMASDLLAQSGAAQRHILLVTDGINTVGQGPEAAWRDVRAKAPETGLHLVAFDVAAKEFDGVRQLGATVVQANSGAELRARIDQIVKTKILLEDEEK